MSAALQYFEENLPHRPYHTDDLAFGLRISGKGRALLARYIQQNQPHAQFWLVFDVDREGAAIDWSDRNAPAPNITVKNPVNGHAHLLYALNIAVRTAPDASVKALKYAAAIERALCEKLGADVNYSGLICKNPFHLEWQVMEWREEAYTLDELADYLDLSASARRSIDKHYGMGRNCHLFETLRKWAYRAIRLGWPDYERWLEAVIQRVEMLNSQFPVPLSEAECRAIGKSVAKYTHRKFSPEGFSAVQAARGRKGGKANSSANQSNKGKKSAAVRWTANDDKRRRALDMYILGASTEDIAVAVGVSSRTVRRWMGSSVEWLIKKQIIKI
ncbi:TPA: replication initiation protein [Escherichia coli]|uniref:replication initiation protein n=11 Tax=Enterobacteriaceae TaxID=543 RepID=UPI0019BB6728|nr:replication initiation protein [Escherichia coli]EER3218440.1 plasmid replication protein [Escherichia coli]MBS8793322.1 replication initiation protein [Escherichia coli]MBS8873169.1 replication initiation protein [Escherichia coli]MBS8909782.1 replication initiation protein [Escherichia coli]MBS9034796.1 replication initiation protein [Escherichia coli]